jgi:triacylglycerol lipase
MQEEKAAVSAKTRFPVVLVHGAGMRKTFFLRPFGRIDRELRRLGCDVSVADIDGFGTVENNAARLKEIVSGILAEKGCGKVNIIAHSKGGLDSRYMIERLGMADAVASLTTLCTPHRGSPIASLILRFPAWLLRVPAFFIDLGFRIAGDSRPDSFTVCRQLRRTAGGEEAASPVPGVYCQSFSSTVKKGARKNDFVMSIPYAFSRFFEKGAETDGLVPRDSALFGVYRGDCLSGSVSHTEIVDFMTGREKREKVYAFYTALCGELAAMGF